MDAVRFLEVELDYGCHDGVRFTLPAGRDPVVVGGPNGAGKTTLVEALARVPFGFNRRISEDNAVLEARRPWGGERCRVRVVFTAADGSRWAIERNFATAAVVLESLDGDVERWQGDGNPGADNVEVREYRRRLARLIGLASFDGYRITACIHQGELLETQLGGDLLRAAAGGHGDVEAARKQIASAHRKLTRRAIAPSERAARKARALEQIGEELESAREALDRARRAEKGRVPLLQARTEANARARVFRDEVGRLEAAQRPLAERRALEAERVHLEKRVDELDEARRRLDRARRDAERAAEDADAVAAGPAYPSDFLERLAVLERLWARHDDLAKRRETADAAFRAAGRPRWALPAAGVLLVGSAAAAVAALVGTPADSAAMLLTVAALALAGAGGLGLLVWRARLKRARRRTDVDELARRCDEIETDIAEQLRGVPGADTLSPTNVDDRRERFRRRLAAEDGLEDARQALADAVAAAGDALDDGAPAGNPAREADPSEAGALLDALDRAAADARRELARKDLELESAGDAGLRLPDGVPAEPDALDDALEERRAEIEGLADELREIDRRLIEQSSGVESPVAVQDRIEGLERRRRELERSAAAHEAAWVLLTDAYAEFRERDEERLLARVSDRIAALSAGALGPVEAPESLAAATVELAGRPVPLASPPLSYGERHATLLAVRLGAADFLAGAGVALPLIVDEPFASLDPERIRGVWTLLREIARERQVIVATQDRLALEWLDVAPDVALEAVPAGG